MPILITHVTEAGLPVRLFWTIDTEDDIRKQILDLYTEGKLSIKDRGQLYSLMMLARIKHREATNADQL